MITTHHYLQNMKEFNKKNLIKALSKGLLPTQCAIGFKKHKQEISRFMKKHNIDVKSIRSKIYEKFFN